MSGETDLKKLLISMHATLNEGIYVFATIPQFEDDIIKKAIGIFKEEEGFTVIISKEDAAVQKLSYEYEASWITLKIHSSLHAVGLTAAFSSALASENISCNVVAGYYHDHIFVARKDADKAMKVLEKLT